jgi:hypothetical protein
MGWDGKDLSTRRSLRHLINNFEIRDIANIADVNDQCNRRGNGKVKQCVANILWFPLIWPEIESFAGCNIGLRIQVKFVNYRVSLIG